MIAPVDILLSRTELHGHFVGPQDAHTYVNTFYISTSGPGQVPFCKVFTALCELWLLL